MRQTKEIKQWLQETIRHIDEDLASGNKGEATTRELHNAQAVLQRLLAGNVAVDKNFLTAILLATHPLTTGRTLSDERGKQSHN